MSDGRGPGRAPSSRVASYSIVDREAVAGILTEGDGRGRVNEADLVCALRPRVVPEYAGAPLAGVLGVPLGGVTQGAGVVRTRADPDRVVCDHAAAIAAAADAGQAAAQAGAPAWTLRPHEPVAGLSPPRFTGMADAIPWHVEQRVQAELRQIGRARATQEHLLDGRRTVDFVMDTLIREVERGDPWDAALRGATAAGEPIRRVDEHAGIVEFRVYPDLGEPATLDHIHASLVPWRAGMEHAIPCCNLERCVAVVPDVPGMPLDARAEPPAPLCACLPPDRLRAWVDDGEAPGPDWPCWLCHVRWVEQRYLFFARIGMTPPYPLNLFQVALDEHGVVGFPTAALLPTVAQRETRGTGVYGHFPRASLLAYVRIGVESGRGRGGAKTRGEAGHQRIVWTPPDFVLARSSSRRGAPHRTVRSAPPLCTRFRWSSNYALAPQMDPPIRRWRLRPVPDSPLGERADAPWDLLRAALSRPAWGLYLDPLFVCPYDDTVRHVLAGRLDGAIAVTEDLGAYGWAGPPPPARGHARAWAAWLRIAWAEEAAPFFVANSHMRLLLQRYVDTHLPLLALAYMQDGWSDEALLAHPAWLTERPSDRHGAWSGALPAAVDLLDEAGLFRTIRPKRNSPEARLIHLLIKQTPHTCVIRGWGSAVMAIARASELECRFLVDLVLVYGLLGNFVNPWGDAACHTPWRPPPLERALLMQAARQAATAGHAAGVRFVRDAQPLLRLAARFYLVDVVQASPALASELANVYNMDHSMREWMAGADRMRRALLECDWRGMARGRAGADAVREAVRQATTIFDGAHNKTLPFQFKLRKATFVALVGKLLTDLAGQDPADLPPRAFFDLRAAPAGDRLDAGVLAAVRRVAVHAAARGDGYVPVGWLSLLVSEDAFRLVVDLYAGYEADSADNQLRSRLGELARSDRQSLLVLQRFFALLNHLQSGLLLPLEARAIRAQEAALYAKHCQITGRPHDPLVERLGVVHYCRCGAILSASSRPPVGPGRAADEKAIHALGIANSGFDLATATVCCTERGKDGPCGLPMRSIQLIGRVLVMNGVAHALCTAPGCGVVTAVEPHARGVHGPVCGYHADSPGPSASTAPPDAVARAPGGDALRAAAFRGRRPHGEAASPVCDACGARSGRAAGDTVLVYDAAAPARLRPASLCAWCRGIAPFLGRRAWDLGELRHALRRAADAGEWVRASRVDWRRAAGAE